MHIILLALGLVISLAGIVLIGFGVRGGALADGEALAIIGTIALIGSLVLIGLASAIRQLRRIAQTLEARPLPRALGPDLADTAPRVAAPAPMLPPEPRVDTPRDRPAPPEPQVAAEAPSSAPPDVPELAPMAPMAPVEEPPDEPPPPAPPAPKRSFGSIWAGAKSPPEAPREALRETPREAPRETYAISTTVIETARVDEDAIAPAAAAPAAAAPAPQIFKSGVIDGMAYTLYTDGSIEAELAEGTVKFASIDELRAYLASRES
jgi:hypothetical protein